MKISKNAGILSVVAATMLLLFAAAPLGRTASQSKEAPTGAPTVSLPIATIGTDVTNFTEPVVTSEIDADDNLIAFQGDFTFDSSVVTFQSVPVAKAGLTAGDDWSVSGRVLSGTGPIRTLRIQGISSGFTALSGSGTLFTLNMTRVSSTSGAFTYLTWKPSPDNFFFIDSNLDEYPTENTSGSITIIAPGATPTPTPSPTPTPTPPGPTPTPTASPSGLVITGTLLYCANHVPNPVGGVTLTLTGTSGGSTVSDASGNYSFSGLASGGSYTVTPSKAARLPGTFGINTYDVTAVRRHYLNLSLLTGCPLAAADVNGDNNANTIDMTGIQRFFLGYTSGFANVGKYKFTPASRTYTGITNDQTAQDYDTLIFGDVYYPFVEPVPTSAPFGEVPGVNEIPATVAAVFLPNVVIDSTTSIPAVVTTSAIDGINKLIGFQGDFTFDERAVTFQSEPVQKAGLTEGDWNVAGNILPGTGPIRTLRISGYSNDFTPLSGKGTLFELRMTRMSTAASQGTQLIWAAPPDNFIFIDADLETQRPGYTGSGSVAPADGRK